MKKSAGKMICALRVILPVLCLLALGFIFYNSLQAGEESVKQSNTAVEIVQDVVAVFDPESPIVTATGEDYERLHMTVRGLAHFAEFALFGALMVWCCFSYTRKKRWLYLPACVVVLVALADEFLQKFIAGRGAEWGDVLVDTLGGFSGVLFALCTVLLGLWIVKKRAKRKRNSEETLCIEVVWRTYE